MRSDVRPEALLNDAAGIAGLTTTLRTLAAMLSTDPTGLGVGSDPDAILNRNQLFGK